MPGNQGVAPTPTPPPPVLGPWRVRGRPQQSEGQTRNVARRKQMRLRGGILKGGFKSSSKGAGGGYDSLPGARRLEGQNQKQTGRQPNNKGTQLTGKPLVHVQTLFRGLGRRPFCYTAAISPLRLVPRRSAASFSTQPCGGHGGPLCSSKPRHLSTQQRLPVAAALCGVCVAIPPRECRCTACHRRAGTPKTEGPAAGRRRLSPVAWPNTHTPDSELAHGRTSGDKGHCTGLPGSTHIHNTQDRKDAPTHTHMHIIGVWDRQGQELISRTCGDRRPLVFETSTSCQSGTDRPLQVRDSGPCTSAMAVHAMQQHSPEPLNTHLLNVCNLGLPFLNKYTTKSSWLNNEP